MEPFTILKGVAAPLMRQNVDTDVIIRIERLIAFGRKELEPYAFESWRYLPDGSEDPEFVLNRDPYRTARILLNGINFGCGSSREGAVWALLCKGIRCVVAPSFGEIFFGNCFQNGVLPIVLPVETVEGLADEARATPTGEFTVDLMRTVITTPSGRAVPFEVEAQRRNMLLEGLDEIGLTMRRERDIVAFQAKDRARRPWVYPEAAA
jgi:3-isopropylmalate/(R)-2-methylmalate dehydratase small subunit